MRKIKRFDWLAMMVNENQFEIGAEIGAAIGITTGFLLERCPTLEKLIVVDLWEPVPGSSLFGRADMEEIFKKKFINDSRVRILKGISWEMASHIEDGSLDFVFIDASHDEESVIKDSKAWTPKVKQGGLICGHDLHFPGVRSAIYKFFGKQRIREAGVDNMWFVKG